MMLASLSPLQVLTPVSGLPAYRPANCGLSGTCSPTNICHSLILNLYPPNMIRVPLTIPSARSPRTPVDLSQIHHHSKLEILSTSSQTRTSHVLVIAASLSPPTPPPPPPWCFAKKFSGSQPRASSYKVKLSECFPVPPSVVVSSHPGPPAYQDKDEELLPVAPTAPSSPVQPPLSPPVLTTVPSDDEQSSSLARADTTLDSVPFHVPSPTFVPEEPCTNVVATDQSLSSSQWSSPEPPGPRLQRQRRPPSYLNDYVRF